MTARVATVAWLGACYHEPSLRPWWQGVLERPSLHVWRRIPSIHRKRSNEKETAPRCEANGCVSYRSTRRISSRRTSQRRSNGQFSASVIGDSFGHAGRRRIAADAGGADFVFLDHASNRVFQTRGHVGFL